MANNNKSSYSLKNILSKNPDASTMAIKIDDIEKHSMDSPSARKPPNQSTSGSGKDSNKAK